MRKLLIILALLCLTLTGYSPEAKVLTIAQGTAINPYLKLWDAVCTIESSNDPYAFNPLECATGIAQIRPIRLTDYNLRTGKDYSLKDCYNVAISKEVFLYYASQYQPFELESCARAWNGSGSATDIYWEKIKIKL